MIIAYDWKTEIPGVFARHADDCPVRNGRPCSCGPLAYRASIREWETNRRMLSPDFPTAGEAKTWLRDQRASLEDAGRVALESGNLGAVVEELLHAAEKGRVADPTGGRYPPDELRELRGALSYVATELGGMNIEDILPSDVEHLVDRLRDSGLSAGRVDSVVAGLHALFSYAIERDLVATDPVGDLTSQWAALEDTDGEQSARTRSASDAAIPEPGQPGVGARRLAPTKRAASRPATPPPAPAPVSSGERSGADGAASEPAAPPSRRPTASRSRRPRSAGPTLDSVVRQFLRAADEGSIDRRPGEPYTPETLLDLRGSMSYVDDRLRAMAVREIRRRHVQKLVDDLRSVGGLPASVVVTVVESLRALYAFAIQRNIVDFSPVVELSMPLDDDRAGDDAATWSYAPAPRPARPTSPPYSVAAPLYQATYAAQPTPAPQAPGPPAAPGQPPPDQQAAQPQPPPYAPDWEFSGSRVRETLAPTTAMMALGGRVVSWTTRFALIAFVLLVLVLARELGLTSLIP